ncbi:serine-rich adhesin for platelets-like [Ostrea edulis]|uniref:serine-rich adhesin for platelets-like n=1 Tax=Ostrea edulis TaxID=37623 RepID=UPI0020948ABE|nr:serine-rich adhesin for platelets-like [Ostrea edulis]
MWNAKIIDGQCAVSDTVGKNPNVDKIESTLTGATFLLQTTAEDYKISCCGVVTQWDIDIATNGTLYAEVWRNVSGNWTLVGVNTITIQAGDVNTVKTEPIAVAQQIAVLDGDFIGFKSSENTIVAYYKTNNGGGSNAKQVQFSTTSAHTVSTTSTFATYTTEKKIEFGLQATLGPGSIPTFAAGLATNSTMTDDTAVGTTLLTVVATDPGDTLNLTLQSTTPASTAINFDPATGVLSTVSQIPIGNTVFVFRATDLCGNFVEHTFTLTVINYPPVINNLPASVEVSEDVSVETQLIVLNVTDASLDDTVTCTISSVTPTLTALYIRYAAGTSNYAISLRAGAGLDYDTDKTYTANVNCTDTKETTNGNFTIYVLRNQPPVITNLPSTANSVDITSSGTSIGTIVFTVTSTDQENDQLFYNMTCTPATCPFKIYDSGAILVDKALAGLNDTAYDMYIYVYDGHTLVGPRSLTVKITDINTPPVVTNLPTTVHVPENTAASTTIFTVTKSDANALDTHTWTSTSSPTSGDLYFTIDPNTGAIKTSSINIDFETIGTTTFLLIAYVSDGQALDSGTVTISIINQNETPMFLLSTYTITGNESTAGSSIGTPPFSVIDPDAGATQTYSQNCPQLTMDPTTKLVTLSTDYDVDTGNPTSLTCTVTVSDGELTDTAILNVNIDNINDNTPTFTASSYSFYAFSTADVGTIIASLPATDGDIDTFGDITYTINQTSTGGNYFGISNTGDLLVTSSLGGFSLGTTLTVTITATDGGGLTDSATITLVIPAATTTTVSTTTDRYMTFFEDTRNVAWFVTCMAVLLGLLILITYIIARYTNFQNIKRSCQRMCRRTRKWKPKRKVISRESTAVSSFSNSVAVHTWNAWKITDSFTPN